MINRRKLDRVLQSIEARRGQFILAALFQREDLPTLWDLVVSAPWLRDGDRKALGWIARPVTKSLAARELHGLARIVTLNPDEPVLKKILTDLGTITEPVEKVGHNLFGLPVEHAYVFRSMRRASTKPGQRSAVRTRRRETVQSGRP